MHRKSGVPTLVGTSLVIGMYVVLSALLFAPLLPHLTTRLIGGGDGVLFAWWMKEIPFQLVHGHDPLLSSLIVHPGPANAMWNTSVPLPALLMAPVTFTAGAVAAVNLTLVASSAVSASAAFWMCRRFGCSLPAAAVGGLLYGFGPSVVGASLGHIHVALVWFPPVAAVLLRRILVTQRGSPVRAGAILGVAAAAQLLTGEELLASSAVVAALGLAVLAMTYRRSIAERWRYSAAALASAAGVGGVLMAGPLALQFLGPNRQHGPILRTAPYVTDLATFISPTKTMLFSPFGLGHLGAHATGNLSEDGGYLGLPLILLALVLLALRWRDPVVRFCAPMAVVAGVISLGGHLHIDGHRTSIPLPEAVFNHLPVLDSFLPARFAVYVMLFVALLIARGITGLAVRPVAQTGLALSLAVTAVFLWPHQALKTVWRPPQPAFFTSSLARSLPSSSLVVIGPQPDPVAPLGMLWQANVGFRFRIASGYVVPWAKDYPGDPIALALLAAQLGQAFPASATPTSVRADLQQQPASAVVIGPGMRNATAVIALFTAAIGRPPLQTGGVAAWILAGPGR